MHQLKGAPFVRRVAPETIIDPIERGNPYLKKFASGAGSKNSMTLDDDSVSDESDSDGVIMIVPQKAKPPVV